MRCTTYNEKTSKKIKYSAIVQLKADGTYREFAVKDGHVQSMSRSGEPTIATNSVVSYNYAKYIMRGRFELGEEIIKTDAKYSKLYNSFIDR